MKPLRGFAPFTLGSLTEPVEVLASVRNKKGSVDAMCAQNPATTRRKPAPANETFAVRLDPESRSLALDLGSDRGTLGPLELLRQGVAFSTAEG